MRPMADLMVLLPGIAGSVLRDSQGRDVWAPTTGTTARALITLGRSITDLELRDGDADDGVRAAMMVPDLHLIPGLWKIDGYAKLSGYLQRQFAVIPGKNFFTFPYDWRRDNRVAARQLMGLSDRWLWQWRQESPQAKLILVCHSMGGLVARYFLECLDGWRDTRRLVTFGTPYQGSLNALNFLAQGIHKDLGPVPVADLARLLRSFPSVYQLLPTYPCVDPGNGRLIQVSEAAGLPHVDAGRAQDAVAFHREIEQAVIAHLDDEEYRHGGYTIHPIVGTFQPTLLSARKSASGVEILGTYPGIELDGDGTVPRVSAMPPEFPDEAEAIFVAERHASLQHNDAVLMRLAWVLDKQNTATFEARLVLVLLPGADAGLKLDEAYGPGEPVSFGFRAADPVAPLVAIVTEAGTGAEVARSDLGAAADWRYGELAPPAPGAYRLTLAGEGVEPVTDTFVVIGKRDPTELSHVGIGSFRRRGAVEISGQATQSGGAFETFGKVPAEAGRSLPAGDDADEPDGEDGSPLLLEQAAEQPAHRVFAAEFEDHPRGQPLNMGEQYTIAFSVDLSSAAAIAVSPWPDELLAQAYRDGEVLDLTVQLDSGDFEIFSGATQRLRVPRAGWSRGKARFDVAPRHNGRCELVASVDYQGNFVHQMKVTITVGGGRAAVEVSARGRPPDSAVVLEPRDISITLEPAMPRGFLCTTMGSVRGRAHLPISATELALAVERVREAMMEVIAWPPAGELVFQTRIDIPADAQDMALRTLARAGARLFQRLFLHPQADADAKHAGEWLRENAMDPGSRLKVLIAADDAPLPWAMLYLGDASEGAELDWNYFLGMRHVVEQLPLQPSMTTWDSKIPSTPELAVSVNVNRAIDDPAKGITLVAGHQRHWMDLAAARDGLTLVSRTTKTELVRALADASTGDQVVYFYCHATASAPNSQDPDTAEIIMGKNDRAMLADLNLDAPTSVQLAGNPLVFINACESAGLSPLFYNGFVPYFMAKGARGVIGTECKMPALFAVEWANAFFDLFLDGAPIGETVLQLRQEFLREHGNPLGLIYAVHCAANTRIVPALAHAKAG